MSDDAASREIARLHAELRVLRDVGNAAEAWVAADPTEPGYTQKSSDLITTVHAMQAFDAARGMPWPAPLQVGDPIPPT